MCEAVGFILSTKGGVLEETREQGLKKLASVGTHEFFSVSGSEGYPLCLKGNPFKLILFYFYKPLERA